MTDQQHNFHSQYGAIALKLKHSAFLLLTVAMCAVVIMFSYPQKTYLETIIESGKITVATRLSPTNYFQEEGINGGFEYTLAEKFAEHLGVELEVISASNNSQLYEALRLNNVHFSASGLAVEPERQQHFDFSASYSLREVHVVYLSRRDFKPAKNFAEIEDQIRVTADSAYEKLLKKLDPEQRNWLSSEYETVLDLLASVHNQTLAYTLVDADTFNAYKNFYPRLKVAFSLPEKLEISWVSKHRKDKSLINEMNLFLSLTSTEQTIADLSKQFFSAKQNLNLVDTLTFRRHLEDRLPLYQDDFEAAAALNELDWRLLAAIGYQESHWNPKAVSPTGVRGLMMLTRNTAKEVGVKDRTDPKESIFGGAKYFKTQMSRIPERIQGPDRIWFALAIYNVGRGHLEDARILTQRAGKNPDIWEDVAKHLPLLTQAKWYKTVKHGYARGHEPVTYVGNIQKYLEQLELEARLEAVQEAQDAKDLEAMNEAINPEENPAKELLPESL